MKEIARACGVGPGTIKAWAVRKKWSSSKALTVGTDLPDDDATLAPWLDARARSWIVETVTLLNKVTGRAARADIPEGWKGLREIVSLLKELIPAGRALYGLDQKQDSKREQVALLVRGDVQVVTGPSPGAQPAIDVEQVTTSSNETVNQMTEEKDPLDGQPVA